MVCNINLQIMPMCEFAIILDANWAKLECNPSRQLVWLTRDSIFFALVVLLFMTFFRISQAVESVTIEANN